MMYKLFVLLVIISIFKPIFSSPITKGDEISQEVSDDVKDLKNLRTESKVNNSESNHQTEPLPTPLPSKEEPPQSSRSAIFRHRGIMEAKKSKYWSEKIQQPPSEGYGQFPSVQYSPTDLAAYVFNTGDEEGVAVAVEELVREGVMGRTDAINYLQDVKQILNYLREQYEHERLMQEYRNRANPKPQLTQRLPNPPREQYISEIESSKRDNFPNPPIITTEHPHQEVIASTSEPRALPLSPSTTSRPKTEASDVKSTGKDTEQKEDDFKRRVPPKNSNSFTLQVIYKLAKDMFTQSIIRDDPVAEETLTRLITFLENEVRSQRISADMKSRVLEVVSTALVDSLRDYHGLLPENPHPLFEEGGLYHHLPDPIGPSVSKVPMSDVYRDLTTLEDHDNLMQIASKSNRKNSS